MTIEQIDTPSLYRPTASPALRRQWFVEGEIPVAIYGLGKMGLPLAAVFAHTTGNVIGADIDRDVVQRINNGHCPVENEPRLPYLVEETVADRSFRATEDPAVAAAAARVHVVVVPTTLKDDRTTDLSSLEAAIRTIGSGLTKEDMVIIESTVPPGTCRSVVQPVLEETSGLDSADFGLAFCPERTSSGRAIHDIRAAYPKVVGGIDDESTLIAELIYGEITENQVIPVSDITAAECVKVFEGVYRDVNIALANELARFVDELAVDVREAIDVANTQPFCDIHDPGAGVGGHCIPYYPYFLINELATQTPLLSTARTVNESMPEFTAMKLLDGLANAGIPLAKATVAVLGVTYRPGVNETRESPALPIIDRLTEAGVSVIAVDPILDDLRSFDVRSTAVSNLPDQDLDGVILVTAHDEFDRIEWSSFDDLVIVDGRDALELDGTRHTVYTIGRG